MSKEIKKNKIEHLIRNSLSRYLMDFQHSGFISIMEVSLSNDFSKASVFISCFGAETEDIIKELNNNIGFFRKKIAKSINLRYTPILVFERYFNNENKKEIMN